MRSKLHLLLLAIALVGGPAFAGPLALQVRQVVIRAPEAEVIRLTKSTSNGDAALVTQLWQAVKEGRATVVSDVTSAMDDSGSGKLHVSSGRYAWLPSELEQETNRLLLPPVAYDEKFFGTVIDCQPRVINLEGFDGRVQVAWETCYAPRGPVPVTWPTSWLDTDNPETGQNNGKAVHGWLDWHDLFGESIKGEIWCADGNLTLLGILPPADQVWPKERKGRWLDVFFAQVTQPGVKPPPPKGVNVDWPPKERTMVFGIGIDAKEALRIMAKRDPRQDAALLQSLLAKTERGEEARMYLCAGSANEAAARRAMESVRMHAYPTEMPSIPSAWGTRGVGTVWACGEEGMELHQDLAAPARSQWQMALDIPEAIMWMPRFRGLDVGIPSAPGPGTHLVSVIHIPEIMAGEGLPANETVLIFVQTASSMPIPDSSGGSGEAEMMVFEIPASEAAAWQPADEKDKTGDDAKRCQALLDRVQAGSATLAAHMVVRSRGEVRTLASVAEDYMTANEFDPPRPTSPLRTRPTALESLPVGSRWEIASLILDSEDLTLLLSHEFVHSTAKPIEPPLEEIIAILAKPNPHHPGAVHHFETWKGSVKLIPGQPCYLGAQKPPGVTRDVLHVAFVTARLLP